MTTLVVGGTGTVGSRVVAGLAKKGGRVLCLARSKEKQKDLPAGVEGRIGNLEDPSSLPAAFAGADSVFLLNALSKTETEQGLAGVEAAKAAGAKRIVYLSVPMPDGSKDIPHFASKIPVEEAIRASGLSHAILRPNNFFQNDLWYQEPIVSHGIYPQPIGSKGMNRVDVRDIADAAVTALTAEGREGDFPIHGPDALTGEETARAWGSHLGREVRYVGDDLDAWSEQARKGLPEWMVHDLRVMYQFFQEYGFAPSAEDLARQRELLPRPPRSFDAFASETAAGWKS